MSAVTVWLLSEGADPNGGDVMHYGTVTSTPYILQLLMDAGGGVSRGSWDRPLLHWAVLVHRGDTLRVLLGHPAVDCTVTFLGRTPEQCARSSGSADLAEVIAQEVRGVGSGGHAYFCDGVSPGRRVDSNPDSVAGSSGDGQPWYGRTACLLGHGCTAVRAPRVALSLSHWWAVVRAAFTRRGGRRRGERGTAGA